MAIPRLGSRGMGPWVGLAIDEWRRESPKGLRRIRKKDTVGHGVALKQGGREAAWALFAELVAVAPGEAGLVLDGDLDEDAVRRLAAADGLAKGQTRVAVLPSPQGEAVSNPIGFLAKGCVAMAALRDDHFELAQTSDAGSEEGYRSLLVKEASEMIEEPMAELVDLLAGSGGHASRAGSAKVSSWLAMSEGSMK